LATEIARHWEKARTVSTMGMMMRGASRLTAPYQESPVITARNTP
jgi:hypothetical protein